MVFDLASVDSVFFVFTVSFFCELFFSSFLETSLLSDIVLLEDSALGISFFGAFVNFSLTGSVFFCFI